VITHPEVEYKSKTTRYTFPSFGAQNLDLPNQSILDIFYNVSTFVFYFVGCPAVVSIEASVVDVGNGDISF
jgi:hypothetical protein